MAKTLFDADVDEDVSVVADAFDSGGIEDNIDQAFGGMETAPQIIILPICQGEKRAEVMELDPLQGCGGVAFAGGRR